LYKEVWAEHEPPPPTPRSAPRTASPQEPELLVELRRYHEVGHLIGAHCYGFTVEALCAVSGRGHCDWRVPDGVPDSMHYARGRLVALAGGWAAMRRFGCRPGTFFEDNCAYDNRRLNELARKYGRDDEAADQLIAWARAEADRIVNERWS